MPSKTEIGTFGLITEHSYDYAPLFKRTYEASEEHEIKDDNMSTHSLTVRYGAGVLDNPPERTYKSIIGGILWAYLTNSNLEETTCHESFEQL